MARDPEKRRRAANDTPESNDVADFEPGSVGTVVAPERPATRIQRTASTSYPYKQEARLPTANASAAIAPIVVPIHLEVSIQLAGSTSTTGVAVAATPVGKVERMVEPYHDDDYTSRQGYDPEFLGVTVPVPNVLDVNRVARMEDGEHVIPYQNFSIVIDRERRMPLVTLSNLDGDRRRPDQRKSYSRRALSGLDEGDIEQWFTDPRVDGGCQLTDYFYTKDRKAFDKGHVVRRDDACWGESYEEVRRANGDTYHLTNCTPQVKAFNQSNAGGRWGELENYIARQAGTSRLSLLAGPIFTNEDPVFQGRLDTATPINVRVPRSYWKIVLAEDAGQLQAFAFVLEQDLTNVDFDEMMRGERPEFAVDADWQDVFVSIDELQAQLPNLTVPELVRNADQYGTEAGRELVERTSAIRR